MRLAGIGDLDAVVSLARELHSTSHWSDVASFDPVSFSRTVGTLVGGDSLLVAEDDAGEVIGVLGFVIVPFYINFALTYAQEVFLYAMSRVHGAGRALIEEFEACARARGAIIGQLATQVGVRDRAVSRVYQSRGYVEAERCFMKRL